jgi:hypothetical protein
LDLNLRLFAKVQPGQTNGAEHDGGQKAPQPLRSDRVKNANDIEWQANRFFIVRRAGKSP